MSANWQARTLQIISEQDLAKIVNTKIIIFGVGGVGGQALESLVRAGFREICIVDYDVVDVTNLNRQVLATQSSLGKAKVEVAKKRMLDIYTEVRINAQFAEVTPQNITNFNLESYDYIVDAIDSFNAKMALIKYALRHNLTIISAMGAGNRLDPTQIEIVDIFKTSGDPLARKVRAELRKENLSGLMVVTSKELPHDNRGPRPGSTPFVPAAAGLALASYIFTNVISK